MTYELHKHFRVTKETRLLAESSLEGCQSMHEQHGGHKLTWFNCESLGVQYSSDTGDGYLIIRPIEE